MNKVDQRRLNRIRLSRGLAVRELARDTGISISVLNRLETSTDPTLSTISVAEFARLADRLGVHVGDLFTNTTDTTTSGPADEPDVQRLGALLLDLKHATPIVVLADALGWTLDRVHRAATALSGTLAPSGLTVFHAGGMLSIRPASDAHDAAMLHVARHPRAKASQRLLTPARARVLFRAEREPISPHSLSKETRVNIATLVKAGILIEDANRHYVPHPDVLDSLRPPRHPSSAKTGSRDRPLSTATAGTVPSTARDGLQ